MIRSTKKRVSLPFNAKIGLVRAQTSEDEQVFIDAANHTTDQLANSWLQFAQLALVNDFCFPSQQEHSNDYCRFHSRKDSPNQNTRASHPHSPPSWQLHAQTAEMAKAGLDSYLLQPFLSEPELDHPDALPPTDGEYLDPYSEEYFDKLVNALKLDGALYAKVDLNIMDQFEALLCKYPEAFIYQVLL